MNLDTELIELVEAVMPPLIDLEQLDMLVKDDEKPNQFDGECEVHDGCRPVSERRLL